MKRKKRITATNKRAEGRKKAVEAIEATIPAIILSKAEMTQALRLRYKILYEGEMIDLTKDKRPVYIEQNDGSQRFWNAINAKKGILKNPLLVDLSRRRFNENSN